MTPSLEEHAALVETAVLYWHLNILHHMMWQDVCAALALVGLLDPFAEIRPSITLLADEVLRADSAVKQMGLYNSTVSSKTWLLLQGKHLDGGNYPEAAKKAEELFALAGTQARERLKEVYPWVDFDMDMKKRAKRYAAAVPKLCRAYFHEKRFNYPHLDQAWQEVSNWAEALAGAFGRMADAHESAKQQIHTKE